MSNAALIRIYRVADIMERDTKDPTIQARAQEIKALVALARKTQGDNDNE